MGNALSPRIDSAQKSGILQLSGLKLTKLPDDAKNLVNIRCLDLSSNRFELIKPWIGRLHSLKVLNVENNKIKCFPTELCHLTKLETLNANQNALTSLTPPGTVANFGNLQNLRFVYLSKNHLTVFPAELCCPSIPINVLDLSDNQISLIPSCVSVLQAIEINLNHNLISVVAKSIAECPRLKVLRLERNKLVLDEFPTELLTNSQVSLICVEGNRFEMRDFYSLPGYSQYMDRFTAMKKKTT
ncbi:unnamed protein product [Calicophoron daubneyi]|uniref:Leucine-rich repeat-containing protein 57 n=1 Tax=Calicophoron daubneyi TaxID=300641 RepID=A0AAV2TWR0_CALDB